MAKHKHHDSAKTLFIKNGLTAKEISDILEVSENSIGKWIAAGGWRELRAAQTASVDSIRARSLAAIDKIYTAAEEDDRVLTDAEADRIAKLSAAMRNLEKGIDSATRFEVLYDFLKFFKAIDESLAIKISKVMPDYVNSKMNARA